MYVYIYRSPGTTGSDEVNYSYTESPSSRVYAREVDLLLLLLALLSPKECHVQDWIYQKRQLNTHRPIQDGSQKADGPTLVAARAPRT